MLDWDKKNVLVTGGGGFLGKYVVEELRKKNVKKLILPSSKEYDLREKFNCKKIVQDIDIVIHLAAKVGGIGMNQERPAEIFYDNIMMGTNLIHEAKEAGVEKFVALGTVCSYPKFADIPFSEDSLWEGYPEETNSAYGLSKKMLIVQSQAYREQYNFESIVLIPTNLYGPNDDLEPTTSHVIPALILKVHNAIKNDLDYITLWGDGLPTRDFLYVEDAAKGIILATEKYNGSLPINLGSEEEISIKELANLICKLMNFRGNIKLDTTKPNGQPRRCVSKKMAEKEFGFKPEINLEEGLTHTIKWFENKNKY